jgi:hypothetical protein
MADQQSPNPQEDKSNPTPPSGAANSNTKNSEQDNKDSKPSAATGQEIKRERPPRPPVKDRKWYKIATDPATPNFIGAIYTAATIILLVATYFILRVTRDSVGTANDALKETRTEFNLLNEPFIQVDSIKVRQVSPFNRHIGFFFVIKNLKPITVKLYGLQTQGGIDTVPKYKIPQDTDKLKKDMIYALDTLKLNKYFNTYITPESPMPGFMPMPFMRQETHDSIYHGRYYFYLTGVVKYENILFKKTRYYFFELEIKPNDFTPNTYCIFLYNENEDQ